MFRTALGSLAAVFLASCAATKPQEMPKRDPLGELMASSAAAVTAALRDLSEASGETRVVMSDRVASQAKPQESAAQRPEGASIAARRGIVTFDSAADIPSAATTAESSASGTTGVVTSGGLLSSPPPGLEKLITVRWTGDLEQLLLRVAQTTGWTLAESKGLRVSPVVISLNAESRSAFDVLRDAGAIAGSSADIHVSAATRTITIHYPKR